MLHGMQQTSEEQPTPNSSRFAGLLAALALPQVEPAGSVDPSDDAAHWNDSDLGEDVATLSYERALRTHARYRPVDHGDWAEAAGSRAGGIEEAAKRDAATGGEGFPAEASDARRMARDGDLRTASVTIRFSQAESERLRRRAGESGLTLSAYLRSCTVEVEALRAQVKEALAELRKAGSKGAREQASEGAREQGNEGAIHPSGRAAVGPGEPWNRKPQRRSWFGWIARVLRRGH